MEIDLLDPVFIAVSTPSNKSSNISCYLGPSNATHLEHADSTIDTMMAIAIIVSLADETIGRALGNAGHFSLLERKIVPEVDRLRNRFLGWKRGGLFGGLGSAPGERAMKFQRRSTRHGGGDKVLFIEFRDIGKDLVRDAGKVLAAKTVGEYIRLPRDMSIDERQ